MIRKSKIWGETQFLFSKNNVEIHRIEIKRGGYCSKHFHNFKFNMFFVETGVLDVKVKENDSNIINSTILYGGDITTVEPRKLHMFLAKEDTIAYEIYWVELNGEDIVRESVGGMHKFEDDKYTGRYFRRRIKTINKQEANYAYQMNFFFTPKMVYDIGCGLGAYLEQFKCLGCEVLGFDKYLDRAKAYCSPNIINNIIKADILNDNKIEKKSDLTLCIELGEHITPLKSADFVRNICNLSNKDIVFVAEGPGKIGNGHINCREKEYWVALFSSFGFPRNRKKELELKNIFESIGDELNLNKNLILFSKREV